MPARYAERVSVRSVEYGRGVFAKRAFRSGARVGLMIGRIVTDGDYDPEYAVDLEGGALEPFAPFKYLNHSCEPNCELVEHVRRDGTPTISVYALAPIKQGTQLTIDYAWPAEEPMRCRCGSAACRGFIVAKEYLHLLVPVPERTAPVKRPSRAPDLRASDIRAPGFREDVSPNARGAARSGARPGSRRDKSLYAAGG